jgi:hypothetical protein
MILTAPPFVLRLAKDERRVFQQNQFGIWTLVKGRKRDRLLFRCKVDRRMLAALRARIARGQQDGYARHVINRVHHG